MTARPRLIYGQDMPGELITAIEIGIRLVYERLGAKADKLFDEVTVEIGSDLIESAGQTFQEQKRIVLDTTKSSLSLQDVEAELIPQGYYEPGDLANIFPEQASQPCSYATYNIIHELGHMIPGEISLQLAPTKYGREKPGEALAEVFVYWIAGAAQSTAARQAIEDIV